MADVKGLKRLRNAGAVRQANWNNPNKKTAKRIAKRIKDYEATIAKFSGDKWIESGGYHRPGSGK